MNSQLRTKLSSGFTLVELIVVVTIIAILGTIGFISYSNYLTTTRDSNRISQLTRIADALQVYTTRNSLPLPDNSVTITGSGTTIAYQGNLGEAVLQTIDYSTTARDPKDNTPFTYYLSADRLNFQLLAFMEEQGSLQSSLPSIGSEVYASTYANRFPKTYGRSLGALTRASDNAPLQSFTTGSFELRTASEPMTLHFSDSDTLTAEGYALYGLGITRLGARGNISCPEGFVPVPGNPEFNTQAFCVAQYEMTYTDADTITSTQGAHYNTIPYEVGKPIVSMAGRYPIANMTQQQAIVACVSMGPGYHLITNNQWMTIARNIEATGSNWSSGRVGQGNLWNGVSGNLGSGDSFVLGCNSRGGNTEIGSFSTRTGPGDNNKCNIRRAHTLSNGSKIWDFSGNVWEYTDRGTATGNIAISGSSEPTGRDDDGIYNFDDMIRNGSALGLGIQHGMGDLVNAQGATNTIFARGGGSAFHTTNNSHAGIYGLSLRASSNIHVNIGFRCAR